MAIFIEQCHTIKYIQARILDAYKTHNNQGITRSTVLSAKSDSDVMFSLQGYQGLMIDISLVY